MVSYRLHGYKSHIERGVSNSGERLWIFVLNSQTNTNLFTYKHNKQTNRYTD